MEIPSLDDQRASTATEDRSPIEVDERNENGSSTSAPSFQSDRQLEFDERSEFSREPEGDQGARGTARTGGPAALKQGTAPSATVHNHKPKIAWEPDFLLSARVFLRETRRDT